MREKERRERTRLGAMCIGERIHTVRFGGKVFGQVQGDAAAVQGLSFSLPPLFSSYTSLPLSLVAASSRFLDLSFPLLSQSLREEKPFFLPAVPPLSHSFIPPLRVRRRGCSFRFSSLGISLRCARGDLGARPPTRELVNYFAQRDTSFLTLVRLLLPSDPAFLSPSFLYLTAFRDLPLFEARCTLYICGDSDARGGGFRAQRQGIRVSKGALSRVPT